MKKVILITLALFSLLSCNKGWGDNHSPKTFEDGVFSFDFDGGHYHQYYRSLGSLSGCSAYALYHPNMDSLALIGNVGKFYQEKNHPSFMQSVYLIVPLEAGSGSGVTFNADKVIAVVETSDNKTNKTLSTTLSFDKLFEGNEYIEGHFTISFTDAYDNTWSIDYGLFKMWARKYSDAFYHNGGYGYVFPYSTGFWTR